VTKSLRITKLEIINSQIRRPAKDRKIRKTTQNIMLADHIIIIIIT